MCALALLPDKTEVLDGAGTCGCEPVGRAGVELRGLAWFEDEVVLPENEAESSVEDVDPVVALMGAQVRHSVVVTRREDELEGLDATRPAGQGQDDRPVVAVDRAQVDARVPGGRRVDELIEGEAVRTGQREKLLQSRTPKACLQPGQRAGRDARLFGEVSERDVAALPQVLQPRPHGIERAVEHVIHDRQFAIWQETLRMRLAVGIIAEGADAWRLTVCPEEGDCMEEQRDTVRDVIVVGGGAAGLSAALTLARARRRVTVLDAGQPRNAPADGVHGLLALDGLSPLELLARGRDEVSRYGGEIVSGEVTGVASASEGFAVTLGDGEVLLCRRLLIATGLVDELPDIPGVRERWGHDVLHCPYCHGWEVRDRRIGVLASGAMSVHQALMFRQWSDDVRFFARDHELTAEDRARLDALDVPVVEGTVAGLEIIQNRLVGVRMDDGQLAEVDAVVVSPRMLARAEAFAGIGIEPSQHPAGTFIESDATGRTTAPGVWVAGNAGDHSAQVGTAAAAGARAAQHINADLVMEDADRAVARVTDESFIRSAGFKPSL